MQSLPRVLLVSHETTLSGAPIQLLQLALWLQERGWPVTVATPERGPISDALEAARVPTEFDQKLLIDQDHLRLRSLARAHDVVIANTILTWQAVQAADREHVPVIWYLHETLVAIRLMQEIDTIRPSLELAQLIVTPTTLTGHIYRDLTRTPIEVVPYGMPDLPAPAPLSAAELRFVTLGSFETRKGQDVLVEAIRGLPPETLARCSFTMAGRVLDADFYENLKERAAGLPQIRFIENLDHAAAESLLRDSAVLVLPSRDETMPIALLEAMRASRAIISTNVGGIGEWLRDELNGLVVPRENATALTSALLRLVDKPALVRHLGAAGRRTFERHFTLDRFGEHFARLLVRVARPTVAAEPAESSFDRWVAQFDTFTPPREFALRRELRAMQQQPLISVLLPVYNSDHGLLRAAIDSVSQQVYSRWELCIADDASTDPAIRPLLEELAASESRIKVHFRERNGHISACSNSALSLATGEFCALLDHDDLFAPHALAHVALEISRHPSAGLIYSDEDKIDERGKRSSPFFKNDWNPELFLGQNFINHLGVYRTEILREIGGFREVFEGSQDYDLALRVIERLQPDRVRHIPRILYHWRMVPGSLAAVADAKSYAKDAARRALADHLQRCGIRGGVEPCPENVESHRVFYELADPPPLVSVVIPTRDHADLLQQCIDSIQHRTDYAAVEFVIVDNNSKEEATAIYLRDLETTVGAQIVRESGVFNFSRLINRGAAAARGEVLAILNNDIEAENRDWLLEMVSHAMQPRTGAVGARLWYPDGTLQHGGVIVGLGGVAGHALYKIPRGHPGYFNNMFLQHNCSAVTGACLVVRKSVFDQAVGFDERNLGISFNDVDFCLRLRELGYANVWTPYANLIHHESASRGHQATPDEQAQFLREATYMQQKWGTKLLRDPFYNPNLTLNWPGFDFAFPPRLRDEVAVEMATCRGFPSLTSAQ